MKFQKFGQEMWDMSKIPPGIQLYTLRNETQRDFLGTLKKVSDMGYKMVEFVDYGEISAFEMKKALDDFGLKTVSTMVDIKALEKDLNKEMDYASAIGAKFIIVPYIPPETFTDESKFQALIASLKKIGRELKHRSFQLLYHPHAHEFEKIGGKYIIDRLLESVGTDLMQLELDLYWVKKAGLDPIATLYKYKGLSPLIHVKDMDKKGDFAEVGRGIINWPANFAILKDVGVKYYFVEQDTSPNPLESVKISLDYLKTIGVT